MLSDQEIAQRKEIVDPVDTSQFQAGRPPSPSRAGAGELCAVPVHGIRHQPAQSSRHEGGNYLAAGIEHNELGAPDGERRDPRRMNDKRLKKMDPLKTSAGPLRVRRADPDATIA